MQQELKSCPFCGVHPLLDMEFNNGMEWPSIKCTFTACHVNPSTSRYRFEKSAIKAWNTRTALEQPTNDVERVARAIYLGMYNKLGANWDAVETKDVWFDLAKKAIAALTQQEDL